VGEGAGAKGGQHTNYVTSQRKEKHYEKKLNPCKRGCADRDHRERPYSAKTAATKNITGHHKYTLVEGSE